MKRKDKPVVIFGAGDIARLAHYYFTNDSAFNVVAFAVDGRFKKSDSFLDLPLINADQILDQYPPVEYSMFIALSYAGLNKTREEKYNYFKAQGYDLVSYISSKCTFLSQYSPGDNCFILEDNTIQPYVKIGSNVILWSGNHIGHDVVIHNHCFISSHVVLSGYVEVKPNCFIGVNATLRDNISVGKESIVGSGAVVMKSIADKSVILPAKSSIIDKKSTDINL